MADPPVNKASWAESYARRFLRTDPGSIAVHYLPENAPDREIRFVVVNEPIAERNDDALEPIDFGIDIGGEVPHSLIVLDVVPSQWERIERRELALPLGWSLHGEIPYSRVVATVSA